jgi:hypothetical protein
VGVARCPQSAIPLAKPRPDVARSPKSPAIPGPPTSLHWSRTLQRARRLLGDQRPANHRSPALLLAAQSERDGPASGLTPGPQTRSVLGGTPDYWFQIVGARYLLRFELVVLAISVSLPRKNGHLGALASSRCAARQPPKPGELRPEEHIQPGVITQFVATLVKSHDQPPAAHRVRAPDRIGNNHAPPTPNTAPRNGTDPACRT